MIFTDDGKVHSTIQEANDYLPSTGGVINLGPGTITLSSRVRLKSNVTLQGCGPSTVITVINSFGAPIGTNAATGAPGDCLITNTNSNATGQSAYTVIDENITLRDFVMDGNGANQGRRIHGGLFQYAQNIKAINVDCRNFGQLNTSSHTQTTETLGNKESAGFWFRNVIECEVYNTKQYATDGIIMSFCKRGHMEYVWANGGTSEVVYFANAIDCSARNVFCWENESCACLVESTTGFESRNIVLQNINQITTNKQDSNPTWFASGIAVSDGKNIEISNCNVSLSYGYGISLFNVDNFTITNCISYNNNRGNTTSGNANISIGGNSTRPTTKGLIKDCILYDDRGTELVAYGIKVTGTQVNGLTIQNSKIKNGTLDGIYIGATTANNVRLVGNDIYSMTRHGIYLDTASNYSLISRNKTYECEQRGIICEDIKKSTITYNKSFNNKQGGVTGNGIDLINTCTDNYIKGNMAFDDQGSPTQANGMTESTNSNRNVFINNFTFNNVTSDFFRTTGSNSLSLTKNNPRMVARYTRDYRQYKNASGSSQSRGFAVAFDSADIYGEEFETPNITGEFRFLGLVADTSIADTAYGQVEYFGRFADAKCNGVIAVGNLLTPTTTGRLVVASAGQLAVAYALEASGGGDADLDVFLILPRTF